MTKTTKEVKMTCTINDKNIPVHGDISYKYTKNGDLELNFTLGKTKLDKVKLTFEKLNYVNEEGKQKSTDNN